MKVVNGNSVLDINRPRVMLGDNDKNKNAYESVNQWESSAPIGENRTVVANKIRDVIARDSAILELSFSDISSLPTVLPESITNLEIYACNKLSTLPDNLPSGITTLIINSCKEIIFLSESTLKNLLELTIVNCPNIVHSGMSLPDSLQRINLYISSNQRILLPFDKFPENLKSIKLSSCFLIDKNKIKDKGIKVDGIATQAAMEIKLGDILYGLYDDKRVLITQLAHFNIFSSKDILSQAKMTDAIWEHRDGLCFDKYRDDEIIKETLTDAERAIGFKVFLEKHKKYNILERHEKKPYRPDKSVENICLSRTSKAGLEFQIMEREGRVFFCVDELVESIPEIAQKKSYQGNSITASELRWLYRHRDHPNVKENVKFCLNGEFISQEKVFSLAGWETYHPKSSK